MIALLVLLASQTSAPAVAPAPVAPTPVADVAPAAITADRSGDVEPPIIEDVAAAASNPQSAPVVTVLMSDRGTGVGTSSVFFRSLPMGPWQKAELKGGTTGLFIARLPEGMQTSGFDYYVEATDIAGNGPVRIGSPEVPIRVERATMATLERIERQRVIEPGPSIHPAFLMISLGVGVLAGAGAGAFALDLVGTNDRLDDVRTELARSDNTPERRNALLASESELETAVTGDAVVATVLGVVAAAGLATGITLVVLSSVE